jgi:hypothetical protein
MIGLAAKKARVLRQYTQSKAPAQKTANASREEAKIRRPAPTRVLRGL